MTTATPHRIKAAQLQRGFSTIHLTLDSEDDGTYSVGGARIYNTSRGGQVEGVSERTFTSLDAARDYANGWWSSLRRKGWQPARSR